MTEKAREEIREDIREENGEKRGAHPVLSEQAIGLVAARFRALGDASRVRLLNLLMQDEASVQDLVAASGLTQTNVSRHLGLLRREGVVARRKDGNRAVYRIIDPNIVTL